MAYQYSQTDPFVQSKRGTGFITDVATGKITRFGTSSFSNGPNIQTQSDDAASQITALDPRKILQQQQEQEQTQLQDALLTAKETATKESRNKLQMLEQEFVVRDRQLQDKFLGPTPKDKTAQDQLNEYSAAVKDLKAQMEIATLKITGKVKPDIDEIDFKGQQAIQKLQQDYRDKQLRLDTIDELEKNGTIVDPIQAKRERLQVAGIQLDISQMRAPQADPYRELQRTDTVLRAIQSQLDQGIKFNFETGQIEGQLSDDDKEQLVQMKNELARYRLTYLLPSVMPQYENVYRNAGRLTSAAEQARGRIVPSTGQPVGTLATNVAAAKAKTQPKVSDPLGLR